MNGKYLVAACGAISSGGGAPLLLSISDGAFQRLYSDANRGIRSSAGGRSAGYATLQTPAVHLAVRAIRERAARNLCCAHVLTRLFDDAVASASDAPGSN
jgi:hypothetical protein